MTAAAARAGSLPLWIVVSRAGAALLGVMLLMNATAASAEVGALASIYNDDRFRGVSLSDGRPVGILDLSYDAPKGFYAALSGRVVAARSEGLKPLGYTLNGGYAARVNSRLTADFGVVHSHYSSYSGLSGRRSYTEAYAGISGKLIGGRLSVSPDYLGTARWTAYGEVDGHVNLSRRTFLNAQIGVLAPIGGTYRSNRPQLDARLGIDQRVGPMTLHGAVTTRSKAYFYRGNTGSGTALILGISAGF